MARPPIGRYELYKRATDKFTDWLTRAARNCRELANENRASTRPALSASEKVTTRELVRYAITIRDAHQRAQEPKTKVPPAVLALLNAVINGRQASARWHATKRRSDVESNESHQYFITALKQIRAILEPLVAISTPTEGKSIGSQASGLANVFSQLEIEEPSAAPLGGEARVEMDKDDSSFALFCHMEDLRDCRNSVKQVWLEYAAGELSLTAASVTTETALGLMRISNEEFVQKYPGFGDWWHLSERFSFDALSCGKVTYVYPKTAGPTNQSLDQDLIDLLCPAAACLLQEVLGYMKVYAQTPHGDEILHKNKWEQPLLSMRLSPYAYDFAFMLRNQTSELLCWVRCITRHSKDFQIYERTEFCMGVAEAYVSGRLPIWLVVACEIYMDMYEVIGDTPGCAIDAYLNGVAEMEKGVHDIRVHLRQTHTDSTGFEDLVKDLKPVFRQMHDRAQGLRYTKEAMESARLTGYDVDESDLGMPMATCWGTPCLLGSSLNGCRWHYHYVGLQIANDHMCVLALATLYSALRRLGLLKATWQDMEFVLSQQKFEMPLLAKPGKNFSAETFLYQYMEALGTPAPRGSRSGVPAVPSAVLVNQRHRLLQPTSDFMVAVVEQVNIEKAAGPVKGYWVESALKKLMHDTEKQGTTSKNSKKSRRRQEFTQAELLAKFKNDFTKDETHVNFDYLGFHLICTRINTALSDLYLTRRGLPKTARLAPWEVVFRLLRDAASTERQGKGPGLADAAIMLNDILSEKGISNKFSKEALNRSSGHLPKTYRPAPGVRPYDPTFTAELWQRFSAHSTAMKSLSGIELVASNASHLTFYSSGGSKREFDLLESIATPFWYIWAMPLEDGCHDDFTIVSNKDGTFYLTDGDDRVKLETGLPLSVLGRRGYDFPRIVLLSAIDWHVQANVTYRPGSVKATPHLQHILDAAERRRNRK